MFARGQSRLELSIGQLTSCNSEECRVGIDTLFSGLASPVLLVMFFFFAVTALLWLLLPFSIFGIKAKLDEQIRVLRSLDERMKVLHLALVELSKERDNSRNSERPEEPGQEPENQLDNPVKDELNHPSPAETRNQGVTGRWQRPAQ